MSDALTTELDLEPIKARYAAASKGPWRSMHAGNSTMEDGLLDHIAEVEGLQRPWEPTWVGWKAAKNHFKSFFRVRDAEFIAHAREDIPALLAEVAALRASASQPHPVANSAEVTVDFSVAASGPTDPPLLAVVEKFAAFRANPQQERQPDHFVVYSFIDTDGPHELTMGMFREARAALRASGRSPSDADREQT